MKKPASQVVVHEKFKDPHTGETLVVYEVRRGADGHIEFRVSEEGRAVSFFHTRGLEMVE